MPVEWALPMTDTGAILPRLVDAALVGRRDDELLGLLCDDLFAHDIELPVARGAFERELEFRSLVWMRVSGGELPCKEPGPF